jgi:hypothetical protein
VSASGTTTRFVLSFLVFGDLRHLLPGVSVVISIATSLHCTKRDGYTDKHYVD